MIRISLTDNFSTLDRLLMVLERDQMPFAIARALTDMAQLGKATITREIPTIFSKGGPPKPFTVNSVVARPASKSTLAAEVFIKDTQAAYLQLEETGGTRSPRGAALVLPGSSAPALHDLHGNLPEGLLRKVARGRADDPCQRQACAARISQARCGWSGWRDRPAWQTAPGFRHRLLRGAWSTWARDRRILRTTRWRTLASADRVRTDGNVPSHLRLPRSPRRGDRACLCAGVDTAAAGGDRIGSLTKRSGRGSFRRGCRTWVFGAAPSR